MKSLFYNLFHGDFAISFWSSFLSSLVVAGLTALIVYLFTDIFKSPELKIVVKQNGFYRDTVLLTRKKNDTYEAVFHLAIKNEGNQSLKKDQGYWHVYVNTLDQGSISALGETNHQRDMITYPVYPKSFLDLNVEYRVSLKSDQIKDFKIPYFLATEYGYFPSTVKMDQRTGAILFKDMGSIGIEIAED